jgi:hypothetical protein
MGQESSPQDKRRRSVGPLGGRPIFHVEASHWVLRSVQCSSPRGSLLQIQGEGVQMRQHTPQHNSPLFLWSLVVFILDALGSLGGVEDSEESEEKSGEVPGLSALLSAYTSTDAYSVVSVRDFLI